MVIKMSGAVFKAAITRMIQRSSKVAVHLWVDKNYLRLQVNDLLLDNLRVPVHICDSDNKEEIVVYFDQTVNMINESEEVTINIAGNVLEIEQESYSFTATSLPEDRVRLNVYDISKSDILYRDSFINFVRSTKALDELAKTLLKGHAPINIENQVVYLAYSNTIFIDSLRLPDISLTSEQSRKLADILSRVNETTKYKYDKDASILHVSIGADEVVSIQAKEVNYQAIREIQEVLQKCTPITKVRMSAYATSMSIICKAFKKTLVEFTICEESIRLFIDNSQSKISIGSKAPSLMTIRISVAQLNSIFRLFGDTTVTIKKGENFVCLEDMNSNKKMIIAGLIY